jgi:hypothetical protein
MIILKTKRPERVSALILGFHFERDGAPVDTATAIREGFMISPGDAPEVVGFLQLVVTNHAHLLEQEPYRSALKREALGQAMPGNPRLN